MLDTVSLSPINELVTSIPQQSITLAEQENGTEIPFTARVSKLLKLHRRRPVWHSPLWTKGSKSENKAVRLVAANRPKSLRDFDQIPMLGRDLLKQVKLMMPELAGKSVLFMGDHDSTSLLLGLLGAMGGSHPSRMTLLDFDERLLVNAETFAKQHGFSEILDARLYNAFDKLPEDLVGKHDWFYTNPPYGCRNNGTSGHLFIARGIESVNPNSGKGCIILPDDEDRPWTGQAMLQTQKLLANSGWNITQKLNQVHRYKLKDDRELASSLMLVTRVEMETLSNPPVPYIGRQVEFDEIPDFYGKSVLPPYPRYIRRDETFDHDWMTR